jgi:hypothetical protein
MVCLRNIRVDTLHKGDIDGGDDDDDDNNNNNLKLHGISVTAVGVRAGFRTAHPVSTTHHSYHFSPTCSPPVVYTQSPGPNEVRCGRAGKNCSEPFNRTNKNKAKLHITSKA